MNMVEGAAELSIGVQNNDVHDAAENLLSIHLPDIIADQGTRLSAVTTSQLRKQFNTNDVAVGFKNDGHTGTEVVVTLPSGELQYNYNDILKGIGDTGMIPNQHIFPLALLYNGFAEQMGQLEDTRVGPVTVDEFEQLALSIESLSSIFPLHDALRNVIQPSTQTYIDEKRKFFSQELSKNETATTGETEALIPEITTSPVHEISSSEPVSPVKPKKWRRRAATFTKVAGVATALSGVTGVVGHEYLQRGKISATHTYNVDDIFAGVPGGDTSTKKPSVLDALVIDVGAPKVQKAVSSEPQIPEMEESPEITMDMQHTSEESPTATENPTEMTEAVKSDESEEEKSHSNNNATIVATEIPSPTATLAPTIISESTQISEPTTPPEPPPPLAPTEQAEVQIGDMNMAEFFLGETIKKALIKRKERYDNDPAFRERIAPELLQKDNLNMVYVGVDLTRDRPNEFNNDGNGLADVIMFLSVNPHTFETTVVSFPRDLFSPEVASYGHMDMDPGWGKINSATMLPKLDNVDSFELIRKIVESATGAPIDMIYKTNIDFMKGYTDESGQKQDGIFDATVPGGVPVWLKTALVDKEYPAENYGTRTASFPQGNQVLHGPDLVTIARMRHQDGNTFGREQRQRLIISSWVNELAKTILTELKDDDANKRFITINQVISGLEKLNQSGDLQLAPEDVKSSTDFLSMIRSMKNATEEVRNDFRALGALSANSAGEVNNLLLTNTADIFTDFGFTAGEGKTLQAIPFPYDPNRQDQIYMLKVGKQDVGVTPGKREFRANPTANNNYMDYWQGTRWQVVDTLLKH